MNHDGYRSGWMTAHHEAAHAVAAILSGLAVGRVSISPSKNERSRGYGGLTQAGLPVSGSLADADESSPRVLRAFANVDSAGYAWETEVMSCDRDHRMKHADIDLRNWINRTEGSMTVVEACEAWDDAVERMGELFNRPEVKAAVLEVSTRLESSKSGEIWGTTVRKVCRRHGLSIGVAA